MRFDIMTLFPEYVDGILSVSIIGRAREAGKIEVALHNIRDYSHDRHRRVDDTPYGGGRGMLIAAPPVIECYEAIPECGRRRTVYMSPKGKLLNQKKAEELAAYDNLVILCGHYEGIDQRAIETVADEEISIGDYVLTGGELPACILTDCVARLIDGVLAEPECHHKESISAGMLEYPQYTMPAEYRGMQVPPVLLGGNHAEIKKWRYREALRETQEKRPDLLY